MKINNKDFKLSDQGNLLLAILLIHFVFFGYICDIYKKSIGDRVLFLDKVFFNPISFVSIIILFIIVFIMVIRERFYEYGIRNSLWLILFVILESLIWYWILFGFDINVIGMMFLNIHFYLTLLSLFIIHLSAAIIGSYLKAKYLQYKKVKA